MQAEFGYDATRSLFGASMPTHEWFQGTGTCGSLWDEPWADPLGPQRPAHDPSDKPGEVSAAPVWHSNQRRASGRVASLYGDSDHNCNMKMEDGDLNSNRITDDILDICDAYNSGPRPSASDAMNFRSESSVQVGTHFSEDGSAMRLESGIDMLPLTNEVSSFWDVLYEDETDSNYALSEFVFEDIFSQGADIIDAQPTRPIYSESHGGMLNGGEQATEGVELAEDVGEADGSNPPAAADGSGETAFAGNADFLSHDAIVPNASPSRLERDEVVKAGTSEESSTGGRDEGGGGRKRVVRSRKRQKDTGKEKEGLLTTLAARNKYLKAEAERLTEEVAAAKRRLIASIVGSP
ncbi:uncharacterized protein LOC116948638 isoform X2 [Petromyzon marinus]|nr:uncharacterized protein LOC116948638 isoform X2 [Petromyzon marinus]